MQVHRHPHRGFTLIEMLTVVAVLIVVLGLMVSLAREVRYRSAEQLTKGELRRLDELTRAFRERHNRLPDVPPILPPDALRGEETKVRAAARANNLRLVEQLKGEIARSDLLEQDRNRSGVRDGIGDLPISLYDGRLLADAWGNPIVFMPDQHPAIGMAPLRGGDDSPAFFFFSAGPDGQYLTREDNLYSYEQTPR